jgi:hypothetical protein
VRGRVRYVASNTIGGEAFSLRNSAEVFGGHALIAAGPQSAGVNDRMDIARGYFSGRLSCSFISCDRIFGLEDTRAITTN